MSKVAVVAKLTAADGKRDELVDTMGAVFGAVEGEEKTEVYALHLDAANENVVWFYELYTDQEGLGTHSGSDAMKKFGGSLAPLLAGRAEITLLHPVRAKGLAFG